MSKNELKPTWLMFEVQFLIMKCIRTDVMFLDVSPVLYLDCELFGELLLCAKRGML